jgi:hypothetical protein
MVGTQRAEVGQTVTLQWHEARDVVAQGKATWLD